jgi:hypothetical protein
MRRLRLLLLALLAAPSVARAQSFFLQQGTLYDGDVAVGAALRAPVVAEAAPGGRVALTYESAAVAWRAHVAPTEAHLQAGVGVETALVAAFAPRMLAGMWAPVVAMAADDVTLGLPPGAPVRTARLSRGVPGAQGAPDNTPWTSPARLFDDDLGLHCGALRLAPAPGAAARWRPRPQFGRRLVGTARGVDTIEVAIAGFVFTGYRPHRPRCRDGRIEGSGTTGGGGVADGVALGRVVVLPADTELFASASAPRGFATLRVVSYGIEALEGRPGRVCDAAGRCARSPAAPTGPARWIVALHDGDAAFLFDAWVHTPAEQLADAPMGHGGYGLYRASDPTWPSPPR